MDSSGSISNDEYKKAKEFLKIIGKSFDIAPTRSRSAIVTYSSNATIMSTFSEHLTERDFAKTVDNMPHEKGQRRIDLALTLAGKNVFPHARPGISKVAILLATGPQTTTISALDLHKASRPLRQDGVRILAVGVGRYLDHQELRSLVDRSEDLFMFESFDSLKLQLKGAMHSFCQATGWLLISVFV